MVEQLVANQLMGVRFSLPAMFSPSLLVSGKDQIAVFIPSGRTDKNLSVACRKTAMIRSFDKLMMLSKVEA